MLISGMLSHAAIAAEDTDTSGDGTTTAESTETSETETAKFSDEEMLIETLLKDEEEAVADAEEAKNDADPDADQTELDQALEDAQAARDSEEEELTGLVEELSEEQIIALNRSLNNANASDLTVDLDAEDLQAVIDGDYNLQQINMLTKSAEAEARFDSLADKFEARAEETGNDKFLEHSERMADKADTERDKFRDKIDKFDTLKDKSAHGAAMKEARMAARDASKDMARGLAKQAAKNAAKQAAKENARDNARENAKQVIKEEGKRAAKSQGKGTDGSG
jgi:hypothetical protein